MIHVVAVITVKPGTRAQLLAAMKANVPLVRAENGCIEYGPVVDAATDMPIQARLGDETVVVIEKWADLAALKAHGAAPHMAAYAAKVKDIIVSRKIHVLENA